HLGGGCRRDRKAIRSRGSQAAITGGESVTSRRIQLHIAEGRYSATGSHRNGATKTSRTAGHGEGDIGTVRRNDIPELVLDIDHNRRAVGDAGGDIAGLNAVNHLRCRGGTHAEAIGGGGGQAAVA